jgi:hypothetical protein
MNLITDIYIEWVEDLGLSPEDILMVLLEKERQINEDLRKRLAKYENC